MPQSPGWYDDPWRRHEERFFNGISWTDDVVDGGQYSTDRGFNTPSGLVDPHLLAQLAELGRTIYGGSMTSTDVSPYYLPAFLAAGCPTEDPAWSTFVDEWSSDLIHAARQNGGWAAAGAFHVAVDFVKSNDWARQPLAELLDLALAAMRDLGVGRSRVPMFAMGRWNELFGA